MFKIFCVGGDYFKISAVLFNILYNAVEKKRKEKLLR